MHRCSRILGEPLRAVARVTLSQISQIGPSQFALRYPPMPIMCLRGAPAPLRSNT